MIKHNYKSLEGWFNMEKQYLELLNSVPEGGIFVELGAYKGKSTCFIATEIANQNRKVNFYTIDSFQGDTNSADIKEVESYKSVNVSKMFEEFSENVKHVNDYIKEVIVSNSYEAANNFEDNSVDAIFIDAGHSYETVKKDILAWLPKMKKDSIMAGHDYTAWKGVGEAFRELFGSPDKVENDCWFIKIKK